MTTSGMIPPTASLVKYENPILVSKNTDKKGAKVGPLRTTDYTMYSYNYMGRLELLNQTSNLQ